MTLKWSPHLGQKRAIKFLLEHPAAILAMAPGMGKTTSVYAMFKILRKRGLAKKMLVIAPLKPAYLVWGPEAHKWEDFDDLKVQVLHGPTRDFNLIADADVCVTNFDSMDWLFGATRAKGSNNRVYVTTDVKKFQKFGFDILVVDELTAVKHTSSGRHKILKTTLHTFGRRIGLTGSLIANGIMDLFGEAYTIDMGKTFGPYITHFRRQYFDKDYNGFTYTLRPGAEKEIYQAAKPLVLSLDAKDYIDQPMLVDVVREFPLPASSVGIYDDLERDLIAQLEDGRSIVAANVASALMKCRQVANGAIYLDPPVAELLDMPKPKGPRQWIELHEEKLELLQDLVHELRGAPLLVAYEFAHDLERLLRTFGKDTPYIGGGVDPREFKKIESDWNKGKLPLLFGHPQSVAHGLNLQGGGAHHVCHFALTWNFELYDQFVRRLMRQGSTATRVFNYHLVASGTVDNTMLTVLKDKDRRQQALYAALKKSRRDRR